MLFQSIALTIAMVAHSLGFPQYGRNHDSKPGRHESQMTGDYGQQRPLAGDIERNAKTDHQRRSHTSGGQLSGGNSGTGSIQVPGGSIRYEESGNLGQGHGKLVEYEKSGGNEHGQGKYFEYEKKNDNEHGQGQYFEYADSSNSGPGERGNPGNVYSSKIERGQGSVVRYEQGGNTASGQGGKLAIDHVGNLAQGQAGKLALEHVSNLAHGQGVSLGHGQVGKMGIAPGDNVMGFAHNDLALAHRGGNLGHGHVSKVEHVQSSFTKYEQSSSTGLHVHGGNPGHVNNLVPVQGGSGHEPEQTVNLLTGNLTPAQGTDHGHGQTINLMPVQGGSSEYAQASKIENVPSGNQHGFGPGDTSNPGHGGSGHVSSGQQHVSGLGPPGDVVKLVQAQGSHYGGGPKQPFGVSSHSSSSSSSYSASYSKYETISTGSSSGLQHGVNYGPTGPSGLTAVGTGGAGSTKFPASGGPEFGSQFGGHAAGPAVEGISGFATVNRQPGSVQSSGGPNGPTDVRTSHY